jgi:hypothetical protein
VKCCKQKRIQQRRQRWHQQREVRPKLPVLGRIAAQNLLGHEDLQRVRHKQVLSEPRTGDGGTCTEIGTSNHAFSASACKHIGRTAVGRRWRQRSHCRLPARAPVRWSEPSALRCRGPASSSLRADIYRGLPRLVRA